MNWNPLEHLWIPRFDRLRLLQKAGFIIGLCWYCMVLRVENLIPRMRLAFGWQNAVVPYDVDNSETVSPIDALLVINEMNQKGARHLGIRPTESTEFLCDTSLCPTTTT